ncbi:MAG: homoserine kinase, partial [Thermoleophilia bacterium]
AAAHMFELQEDLLGHVAELEGHPDNAAAALLGGFVIVTDGDVARFEPPDGLEAVIVVPHAAVRTAVARKALPDAVPLADAAANVARGAMLTLGLATGDLSLVGRGLADRLHQPYRAPLFPRSAALLARASELGAIGATISGAGPTVLFWTQADATGAVVRRLEREADGWADVLRAPFESQGADVREL